MVWLILTSFSSHSLSDNQQKTISSSTVTNPVDTGKTLADSPSLPWSKVGRHDIIYTHIRGWSLMHEYGTLYQLNPSLSYFWGLLYISWLGKVPNKNHWNSPINISLFHIYEPYRSNGKSPEINHRGSSTGTPWRSTTTWPWTHAIPTCRAPHRVRTSSSNAWRWQLVVLGGFF